VTATLGCEEGHGWSQNLGSDPYFGLMMTSRGGTARAKKRAKNESERGIRIDVLSIEELAGWRPPGTVTTTYRFPRVYQDKAQAQLRRVEESKAPLLTETGAMLRISRHYGMSRPDADIQTDQSDRALAALRNAGVEDPVHVSHGIQIGRGGAPR
jgi:hypothetical protein